MEDKRYFIATGFNKNSLLTLHFYKVLEFLQSEHSIKIDKDQFPYIELTQPVYLDPKELQLFQKIVEESTEKMHDMNIRFAGFSHFNQSKISVDIFDFENRLLEVNNKILRAVTEKLQSPFTFSQDEFNPSADLICASEEKPIPNTFEILESLRKKFNQNFIIPIDYIFLIEAGNLMNRVILWEENYSMTNR